MSMTLGREAFRRFFVPFFVVVTALLSVVLCFGVLLYVASIWLPHYEYVERIPSPDGNDVIDVVKGGEISAIDDIRYRLYVFPAEIAPEEPHSRETIPMAGIWRDDRFLIYVGAATPLLRWTSLHEIEIDCDDANCSISQFIPRRASASHSKTPKRPY